MWRVLGHCQQLVLGAAFLQEGGGRHYRRLREGPSCQFLPGGPRQDLCGAEGVYCPHLVG